MNDTQREFLVTKVEKYNEEVDQLQANITDNSFILGMVASTLFFPMLALTRPEETYIKILAIVTIFIGANFSIYQLVNIISTIAKKAGLENRINEINEKLGLLENEDEISNQSEIMPLEKSKSR